MAVLDFLRQLRGVNTPYLGAYTTAEIATINAAIASGGYAPALGSHCVNSETGTVMYLRGIGVAASLVDGAGNSATSIAALALLALARTSAMAVGTTYATEQGYTYRAISTSRLVPIGLSPILAGNKATLLGDSINAQAGVFPNNWTTGAPCWAQGHQNVPFEFVQNRAVSGTSFNQILSSQVPSTITDATDVAWLHAGANIIYASNANGQKVQDAMVSFRAVLEALVPYKRLVIVDSVDPMVNSVQDRSLEIPRINAGMAAICLEYPNVFWNDTYSQLVDPASALGDILVVNTCDGSVHTSTRGAAVKGAQSAKNLARGVLVVNPYTATPLTGMPNFGGSTGTTTPGTGTITGSSGNFSPTGINIANTVGSPAVTTSLKFDPVSGATTGNRVQLTITNTNGAAAQTVVSLQDKTLFNAQLSVGDVIRGWVWIRTKSVTAAINLTAKMRLNGVDTYWATTNTARESATAANNLLTGVDVRVPIGPITITAAVTTLDIQGIVDLPATTGSIVCDIYDFQIEKLT